MRGFHLAEGARAGSLCQSSTIYTASDYESRSVCVGAGLNGEARPHAMVVAHRYHQSDANFVALTIDDQIVLHSIKIDGI
jgi:hypothetical protein